MGVGLARLKSDRIQTENELISFCNIQFKDTAHIMTLTDRSSQCQVLNMELISPSSNYLKMTVPQLPNAKVCARTYI